MNRCSIKKLFLKILPYSQENTCVGVSFLIKIRAFSPAKKTPTQTFPMNIVKFLRTPVLKNSCERLFERFAAWINNITSNMWIEEEIFSKKPKKTKQKQTKKQRQKNILKLRWMKKTCLFMMLLIISFFSISPVHIRQCLPT